MKMKKIQTRKAEVDILKDVQKKSFERSFKLSTKAIDEDKRTVEIAFSSEEPYERWFGMEVLGHKSGEMRTERLENAPLLVNHDVNKQVGVVESFSVGSDGVARSVVRFGRSAFAEEIFNDVKDGIRSQISVGYRVHEMELVAKNDEMSTYRVTDWEPFENSIVAIAADNVGAGVGKSDSEIEDIEKVKVNVKKSEPIIKESIMTPEELKALQEKHARELKEAQESGNEAVKATQKRIADITTLAEKFDAEEIARDFINSDKTVEEFKDAILARNIKREEETSADIGMTEKEVRQFSFLRAMRSMAFPNNSKLAKAAAFERECSDACAKELGKEPDGFMLPNDILRAPLVDDAAFRKLPEQMKRDLVVGTATAGGHTVSTDLLASSFIDLLRNRIVVAQMATMLTGLVGNIAIPRHTGSQSSSWEAENAAATEGQASFDQVTMSPKTNTAWTEYSRKLLLQSSIDIEAFVRSDLVSIIALAIDLAAINGSGSGNEPEGILNTTGIGDVAGGTNGLAPTWGHIVDLETEVAQDNADVGRLAYLSNAKVRGALKQTEKASSTAQFIMSGGDVNGYNMAISNQVPSNLDKGTSTGVCSAIVFGNFADLFIGMWGGLDLLVDPFSNSTTGATRVVVFQDIDIAVRHPESFAAMQDALTS